jgi:hypothetical protein
MGYFKRALGLSRPEWKLVVCALLCLACNNAATLALPNFQGSIVSTPLFNHMLASYRFSCVHVLQSLSSSTPYLSVTS